MIGATNSACENKVSLACYGLSDVARVVVSFGGRSSRSDLDHRRSDFDTVASPSCTPVAHLILFVCSSTAVLYGSGERM